MNTHCVRTYTFPHHTLNRNVLPHAKQSPAATALPTGLPDAPHLLQHTLVRMIANGELLASSHNPTKQSPAATALPTGLVDAPHLLQHAFVRVIANSELLTSSHRPTGLHNDDVGQQPRHALLRLDALP